MEQAKVKWAYWTPEALEIGYKQKENMKVVGESKNGENYWITWNGIKSRYSYPKEYITVKINS